MAQSAYPHGFSATILTHTLGTRPYVNQVIAAELRQDRDPAPDQADDGNAFIWRWTGPTASAHDKLRHRPAASSPTRTPTANSSVAATSSREATTRRLLAPGGRHAARPGTRHIDPRQRFAVYSRLFPRLQADLPYVGLFVSDTTAALSGKFTYTDFSPWIRYLPWALNIKRAA